MVLKYTYDKVILAHTSNDNVAEYFYYIDFINSWCANNYLNVNVTKTSEIKWLFRNKKKTKIMSVLLNGK